MRRVFKRLLAPFIVVLLISSFLGVFALAKHSSKSADLTAAGLNLRLPWLSGTYYINGGYSYSCGDHDGSIDKHTYTWDKNAIDFALPYGTAVTAVFDGTITLDPNQAGGYGNTEWITNSSGYRAVYAHLSDFNGLSNRPVKQGQVIAHSGSAGSGPHLHFSLRQGGGGAYDGSPVIPEPMSGYTGFGNYGYCTGIVSPGFNPGPGGWWLGPTPDTGTVKTPGSKVEINFRAADNSNRGLDHGNLTIWTQSHGWQVLPAYPGGPTPPTKHFNGETGTSDVYAWFIMPNEPVIVSADIYARNTSYQLSPQGERGICISATQCPKAQIAYTNPITGGYGGGGDPTSTDGINICQNANFGGPCSVFTYTGDNATVQPLGARSRSLDSVQFLGSYAGNYDVVFCLKDGCPSSDSEIFRDDPDFSRRLVQNQYVAIRIVKLTPPVATPGAQLCEGKNFTGPCVILPIGEFNRGDSGPWGSNSQVSSVRYVNGWDHIHYHIRLWTQRDWNKAGNPNVGTPYNVDQDAIADLDNKDGTNPNPGNNFDNRIQSVQIYQEQPPNATQVSPTDGTALPSGSTSLHLTFDNGDTFTVHVWNPTLNKDVIWTDTSTNFLDITGLTNGATYDWQVLGANKLGAGNWSSIWTFSVGASQATPTPSPTNTPRPNPTPTLLGSVNIDSYCLSQGYTISWSDGGTKYGLVCIKLTPHDIDITSACYWQYGINDVVAAGGSSTNPNGWKCYDSQNVLLGGFDMNQYCQAVFLFNCHIDATSSTGWKDLEDDGNILHLPVDMVSACQWQYNRTKVTVQDGSSTNPTAWRCYAN